MPNRRFSSEVVDEVIEAYKRKYDERIVAGPRCTGQQLGFTRIQQLPLTIMLRIRRGKRGADVVARPIAAMSSVTSSETPGDTESRLCGLRSPADDISSDSVRRVGRH